MSLPGGGSNIGEHADAHVRPREGLIEENEDTLGGTPVIRGTRLSVYALLGRIDRGESIDSILEDYPHLNAEAIDTAVTFARARPLVGRPSGRPWEKGA